MKALLRAGIVCLFAIRFYASAELPTVWSTRFSPSTNKLNAIAYGNGLFVAAGAANTILTSSDGITWVQQTGGNPDLYSMTHGSTGFAAGGQTGSLIAFSSNGVTWTNVLDTIGMQQLNGITYGYGLFVAVGRGSFSGTSYILTSTNGINWVSRLSPATNFLFAVTPAFNTDGIGWADELFVAVGDHGTIVTSTNGIDWVLRNSGTANPLRSVIFHQRLIAAGDSGTVLTSSDGINWSPAAPPAFNVNGLASSGTALVAVGKYISGRLHASADGLSWPGDPVQFPHSLNAIAYGGGSFVAVGDQGLIIQSGNSTSTSTTNDWLKFTSGYWEEPYWSLNQLPNMSQDLVAFRSPGFKALAIGANTTANYSNSLSIKNLLVEAPAGSLNQLLLNYAGTNTPLFVASDFSLGTNASVVSHFSALKGGNFYMSGPATFADESVLSFNQIIVGRNAGAELDVTNSSVSAGKLVVSQGATGTVNQTAGASQITSLELYSGGVYNLNGGLLNAQTLQLQFLGGPGSAQFNLLNGAMDVNTINLGRRQDTVVDATGQFLFQSGWLICSNLNFLNGTFTQTGGTNNSTYVNVPWVDDSRGDYFLSGGTLISRTVTLGAVLSPSTTPGEGNFVQSGGVHTNKSVALWGEIRHQANRVYGTYSLSGGRLVTDSVSITGGSFSQTGGTNVIRELGIDGAGGYGLSNGLLVSSNVTLHSYGCVESSFVQNNGTTAINNLLSMDGYVRAELRGGSLIVPNIDIGPGSRLRILGGAVSNPGMVTIRGGALVVNGLSLGLGQLQVIGVPAFVCVSSQPLTSTLDVGTVGSTVLHFQDSRDVPWSGSELSIVNWSPGTNNSGDHIFVGTNSSGLTAAQLAELKFVNPQGLPPGDYRAQIINTGEIVPSLSPTLTFTRTSALILNWSGTYQLFTSTNVTGPYTVITNATSPYTNGFSEPRRYFYLR
jgi:hypothetical protein